MVEETGGERDLRKDWERIVLESHRGACSNCGGEDCLRVLMVVPGEAGGTLKPSNGTVLCRGCEMALEGWRSRSRDCREKHPLNLWISEDLHHRLVAMLEEPGGFGSKSSLVRWLVGRFILEDPGKFADLSCYQDPPSPARVKINLWVGSDDYGVFKLKVQRLGHTVTSAVTALLMMYVQLRERRDR